MALRGFVGVEGLDGDPGRDDEVHGEVGDAACAVALRGAFQDVLFREVRVIRSVDLNEALSSRRRRKRPTRPTLPLELHLGNRTSIPPVPTLGRTDSNLRIGRPHPLTSEAPRRYSKSF